MVSASSEKQPLSSQLYAEHKRQAPTHGTSLEGQGGNTEEAYDISDRDESRGGALRGETGLAEGGAVLSQVVREGLRGSTLQGRGAREPGRDQGQEDQQMQRP